jgi:DNA-binding PadR family transcriptional regulator
MPAKRPIADAPLKPHFFLVLLALADGPSHGYRIKQIVEARGGLRLDPGSLYRLIARLLEEGLIGEHAGHAADDPRRRTYELTDRGRGTLLAETARMADLVAAVREKKTLRRPRFA